ncbi:MAG: hypothetical protein JXL97_18970 [Bacteroidales bacterium]|nr:hypothetical protein [Bacteroidales bacterium]
MNLRTQTKYAVYTISVLIASFMRLVVGKIISRYINEASYLSVLIDMLVIILVFIPVIRIFEKFTMKATKTYLDSAKKISKNKRKGLWWALFFAFFVMFILFAIVKYNLNFIKDAFEYFKLLFGQT